jgi:tetratricopeptide (TPR) repeat protein
MTNQSDWDRLNALLESALELSGQARQDFIDERCGDDDALKKELLEMISLDDTGSDAVHDVLRRIVREAVPPWPEGLSDTLGSAEATLEPGDKIGNFEIVRLLGAGGMGEVYEAQQHEPVSRLVALKVVRYGHRDPIVMARFEAERQTLASLGHTAIAAVHDAGFAPDGRPYFAMELVDGVPIDEYVREHRMSLPSLLRLLIEVCSGVQHAHQRGVIHRDLKPSNILVMDQDGKPTAKLIDFGIAKAVTAGDDSKPLLTQTGQLIGTLRYMSPEQADSMGYDVDTRTDVYALGTIIYELLTGRHPLSTTALASPSLTERQREILESEPLPPSQVTDPSRDGARSRAELTGDLDWILLKTLRKEREQRYSSVAELARDLERHLENEPVEACPPSAIYRWRKFYRRNRVGVVAAAAVGLSIVAGVAAGGVGLIRALAAEQEALQQASTAQEVSRFLVGLFEASDPNSDSYADVTARTLLDRGAAELDGRLLDQPEIKAELRRTLGNVYEILGQLSESFENRKEAAELYAQLEDPDPVAYGTILADLAVAHRRQGDLERAHDAARRGLEIMRTADPLDGVTESYGLGVLGRTKLALGEFEAAEPLMQEALEVIARAAPGSAEHATGAYDLAGMYFFTGRYAEAVPFVQEAIDIRLAMDPEAPRIGDMYDGMGILQLQLGRYDDAEVSLRKGLDARREYFGDDHYLVAQSLQNLGETAYFSGDLPGAVSVLSEAVAVSERAGDDVEAQNAAGRYELLAMALAESGEIARAYEAVNTAAALRQGVTPEGHPDATLVDHALAVVMLEDGRYLESAQLLEAVAEVRNEGAATADAIDIYASLVAAYRGAGDTEAARELCETVMSKLDLSENAHQRMVEQFERSCSEV